jgi:DNA-binding response OmpR family regulator
MARYLHRRGCDVEVCETRSGARSELETKSFAAVVADWSLAGAELIAGIPSGPLVARVVVSSGHPRGSLALPEGAHFLQKPFRPQDLDAALEGVLPDVPGD